MMICVDVCYGERGATAAGVLFRRWDDPRPAEEYLAFVEDVAEYVPGSFYKRELPCILALLEKIDRTPDIIVVDGYVWLNREKKPGLGAYLFRALGKRVPVIGVAKSPYGKAESEWEVYRGRSRKPLHVTATGMDETSARELIGKMSGNHRIPTLLKHVDRLCRSKRDGHSQSCRKNIRVNMTERDTRE